MPRPHSTDSRSRASGSTHQGALWTAVSLAWRSVALGGVVSLAVVISLVAWLVLRSALRVDPVMGRERLWLQYGQHKPPYALVQLDQRKYSTPGKVYDVDLELVVPVNHNNLDLGNFMASLSLVDAAGQHVLTESRPALLPHPSAQACLVPSSRSSTLSHILLYPVTLFKRTAAPIASCLAPFVAPSTGPCSQTLRIPLLERASFVAPASSRAVARSPQASRWGRKSQARAASSGPATALFVQIGREDAHPSPSEVEKAVASAVSTEEGSARAVVRQEATPRPRELQVLEAWVRIEVKLSGLRSFLYRHPYLFFSTFFPSFLSLELLAAVAAYIVFVARAEPTSTSDESLVEPKRRIRRNESASASGDDDVKPLVSLVRRTSALPALDAENAENADRLAAAEERAARRMRLGPGGVGMSEVFSAEEGVLGTGTEYDDDEGTEVGDSVSEVGAGLSASASRVVKEEEYDGEGTVAGSATTRRTISTFGPSLAGTTSTRTTATGSAPGPSAEGLRGRGAGGDAVKDE
ncbi:hypothetical protein JCM8208_001932 [Rhodotorula glutinis]